jgi:Glycogen recognition site of AMP-activated protein kinase
VAWANTINEERKPGIMDPTALPRSIARLQYAAVRLPFAVLDEWVVASPWGQGAQGFGLFLGSLDRFAGYLLADEQISQRGQALMRRTEHPAKAGAPGTKAPVRPARDERRWPAGSADARQAAGQDRKTGGTIAADRDQDDKRSVRRAADGLAMTGKQRAAARDALARQAAGEQPGRPAGPATRAGTVDVRFTLPAEVQADTVALCGEFNNWSTKDIQLERGGDGSWQATVALKPGRSYRYRYLLDGERWESGQADHYAPNAYGGTDSVVVVE